MTQFKNGDEYIMEVTFTEDMVNQFSILSGDNNPIHMDDNKVDIKYHKKRIVHGMLIGAFFSNIIGTKLPGFGTVYISQNFDFIKPVYVGETVMIIVRIKRIIMNFAILETQCFDMKKELLVNGIAKVMIPI